MCLFSARDVEGAFVVRKVRTMGKPHVFCQPKLAGLSKHGRVPYTYRTRVLGKPHVCDFWTRRGSGFPPLRVISKLASDLRLTVHGSAEPFWYLLSLRQSFEEPFEDQFCGASREPVLLDKVRGIAVPTPPPPPPISVSDV